MKKKAELEASRIRKQLYARIQRKLARLAPYLARIDRNIKRNISQLTALELIDLLDNHEITSFEITLVFIERAGTLGLKNNYVIDQMFEQALQEARQCDRVREENKGKKSWKFGDDLEKTFSPFYGIPLSLKEVILYKGRQVYIGQVWPINSIPTQQPLFIQMILRMGFIPFVRTNVPPAGKTFETTNRIFGPCLNPWNIERNCGGSSGGQSGIISSKCSPFGIGSDIGGSVRIPAEWCGLATLKHGNRYTRLGNCYYGSYSNGLPVKSELSPMSRSVKDITLFMQFAFDPKNYPQIPVHKQDIYLKQQSFDSGLWKKQKLTIGYYKNINQQYRTSRGHENVLEECVGILKQKGHTLKQIDIPQLKEVFFFFMSLFLSDSELKAVSEPANKEPPIKQYRIYYIMSMLPWLLKSIIIALIKKRNPRMAKLIELSKAMNGPEIVKKIYENMKKRQARISQYLEDQQIDVWITPGFPVPAIKHGSSSKFGYLLCHTTPWNALHYPSGNVPVRLMKEGEDVVGDDGFNDILTNDMRKSLQGARGLPLGIQVTSFPCNDEIVLKVMEQIEESTKFRQKYKCPVFT